MEVHIILQLVLMGLILMCDKRSRAANHCFTGALTGVTRTGRRRSSVLSNGMQGQRKCARF